jgi:hypothetical protein
MGTTYLAERSTDTPFEIESDMRLSTKHIKSGKLSVQDYVESIAARYPLLGMAVLDEESLKVVEETALKAVRLLLDRENVYPWVHLAVFLTMVHYAKNWNRADTKGFWVYIANQFERRDYQRIYPFLTTAVKAACQRYNRLFIMDVNGDNNYYSTVLAHALSPNKSFFALCEFLVKFYRNNLDCSVYEDDPAIGRMVSVLRDRCQGATMEQDDDIRGNVYGIQAGLKVLITMRPGYMKQFLTKAMQKIGTLLDGGELPGKDYLDVLLTQWYISKLNETTSHTARGTASISSIKRAAPTHKRTTDIAFSYGRIRVEYVLDDEGEPALRVPSIRLASRDNPILTIRSTGDTVYQQTIGIYGNDYAATSEEVIVPLSDISDADFTDLDVTLTIEDKVIYSSGNSLHIKALLFKDAKPQTSRTIEEGNYTLFAPEQVNIEFQGTVERQRRAYFAQLCDIYVQGEVSIFAAGSLLYCSRPPVGSLRFRLPQTPMEYVVNGNAYPIYSRSDFSITAVGTLDKANPVASLQNGETLGFQSKDTNLIQFETPEENSGYTLTLTDAATSRLLDETRFYITDDYAVRFDSPYYLGTSENGSVVLDINGEHFDVPLVGFTVKASIPYGSGEIQIQVPRIKLLLDGNPIPTTAVWKGNISPSSSLQVICPESLSVSLLFGGEPIQRRNGIGGHDFVIGNAVAAYDGANEKIAVSLLVADEKVPLFDVVFKMTLTEPPQFHLSDNTLMWLNGNAFIGDENTKLAFVFAPKRGNPISLAISPTERVLSRNFPARSERYHYQVIALTDTAFGTSKTTLADGYVIFGDKAAVIFRGETLKITQVLEEGVHTEIKPVYVEEINYIGTENLGYTDLSGEYAHYTAKLFFLTRNGKRHFTDLNPVDIYLVNETAGRIHISFDDGAGLFVDKSGDYGIELYKHADPPPKLARYFFIPDFFEYKYSKEIN